MNSKPSIQMKRTLVTTLVCAAGISVLGIGSLRAEPAKVDAVIDLLHQAETSNEPLPLLQKAKEELKTFKAQPNQEAMILRHQGPRKRAGVDIGAAKHKEEAMEAIDKAIDTAKAGKPAVPASGAQALRSAMDTPGGDLKSKIENAIAKVHMAGELKR